MGLCSHTGPLYTSHPRRGLDAGLAQAPVCSLTSLSSLPAGQDGRRGEGGEQRGQLWTTSLSCRGVDILAVTWLLGCPRIILCLTLEGVTSPLMPNITSSHPLAPNVHRTPDLSWPAHLPGLSWPAHLPDLSWPAHLPSLSWPAHVSTPALTPHSSHSPTPAAPAS